MKCNKSNDAKAFERSGHPRKPPKVQTGSKLKAGEEVNKAMEKLRHADKETLPDELRNEVEER